VWLKDELPATLCRRQFSFLHPRQRGKVGDASLCMTAAAALPPRVMPVHTWRQVVGCACIFIVLACMVWPSAWAETPGKAGATVKFSAAVNWDFPRLEKLDAWKNTATVIQRSLGRWHAREVRGIRVENTDRQAFRAFFTQVEKSGAGDWNFLYLASHQGRDGTWRFPRDEPQSWPQILAGMRTPANSARFVILDACFAEAADRPTLLEGLGAAGILFASSETEEIHEVNFRQRFPMDFSRRYPAEEQWLRNELGAGWNGRVSFLGFVWLRAFLATPDAPENLEEWNRFFRRCETLAHDFREGRGAPLAATIRFHAPPGRTGQ
jgi:hypothetical protein